MIHLDFETRSRLDIKRTGSSRYSEHWSTQVVCINYAFDDGSVRTWHRGFEGLPHEDFPQELCDRVAAGEHVEAHHAAFELAVWNNCLVREFPAFPRLDGDQMRCSAAKAALFSLPRDLDGACERLGLTERKDPRGARLIQQLSRPRKDGEFNEDPELLRQFIYEYGPQDVASERALSKALPDQPPRERELWLMDQRMNRRGIRCDVEAVKTAVRLGEEEVSEIGQRLWELTGGAVLKPSSRPSILRWANENGVPIRNTQADYLNELIDLEAETPVYNRPDVMEVLRLCVDGNRTSTSKYDAMLDQVCSDGRLRDLMLFRGADRTGRWAGRLTQPHNFVRGFGLKKGFDTMGPAWEDIVSGDADRIRMMHGSVTECLAKAARGALVASPGRDLLVADFSAIEARVLLWLAEDEEGLEVFRRGEDIYLYMAADIYKRSDLTKDDFEERQMGKKAVLGLGYQMGGEKFDDECAAEGIYKPRKFFNEVVRVYREERFPKVASLWGETEKAAVTAVLNPGRAFRARRVVYFVRGRFLHCKLPSGRLLSYYSPKLRHWATAKWNCRNKQGKEATIRVTRPDGEPRWKTVERGLKVAKEAEKEILGHPNDFEEGGHDQLTYEGMDQKTHKWVRRATYGGSLVENNTQAGAADFMAEGMWAVDQHPTYDLLLSVHDEGIGEADEFEGDVREFEELLCTTPSWGQGCPIRAEGWRGKRYRK